MVIQVHPKRISSEGFVWHVYAPAGGKYAEVDPRSGDVLIASPGTLPDEMLSVIGALAEWCHTDARNFAGANRKKIQAAVNYKASVY
jgi:hypothetical protein